ncbi:transposase [Paenibacillus sp. EKM212P]|uniref:transposase n=1 Tax=Paenibacillus sp. EKM212P TaxID=1683680 RepID=UPI0013EAA3B1|nr:transposase [Paenibacillus sp. EKM212P]
MCREIKSFDQIAKFLTYLVATQLQEHTGKAPVVVLEVVAEIGVARQFVGPKQLVAYTGLRQRANQKLKVY